MEWLRDLVISIAGIASTVFLIFLAVISLIIYARLRRILRSIQSTSSSVEKIASIAANDVVEPLTVLATILKGILQGIGSVIEAFKGGKDNE